MLRIIVLGSAIAALVLYFSLMLYYFPQIYQSIPMQKPEPIVTNITLAGSVSLGEPVLISVVGTNRGEDADMQIVSIGFPNMTDTNVQVIRHNFTQTPIFVKPGSEVGSEYTGETMVTAQYPSVEAFSRPWQAGDTYGITVQVTPEKEGRFAIFVKSVAFPYSWDKAHWPAQGVVDYQKESVEVYYVEVTKS